MSTITTNQRKAYVAQAEDAARILAQRLRNLSPAQQAALLASVAHGAECPVDITLTTHETGDGMDAAMLLDGDLTPASDGTWAWEIGSGCVLRIEVLP